MKQIPRTLALLTISYATAVTATAETSHPSTTSLGSVANNLMDTVTFGTDFVGSIALSLGIVFLFGALIKYLRYRRNPLATPISTVVWLVIMGLVLVLLPFAYKITESGVPMTMMGS